MRPIGYVLAAAATVLAAALGLSGFILSDASAQREAVPNTVPAAAAGQVTLTGRITGLPKSRRRITVTVEAVSLKTGQVLAAADLRDRYSLGVPAGPYLVEVDVFDLRRGRHATAYRAVLAKGKRATVNVQVHNAVSLRPLPLIGAVGAGASLGIGDVHITTPVGGLRGGAETGITVGLLPICDQAGGKLFDRGRLIQQAIKAEQKLSDEGRTDVKFHFNPPPVDATIQGSIEVGPNGGPRADLTVTDSNGTVIKHYIVDGDPGDWNNLGRFENQVGSGLGRDLLQNPPAQDPCSPEPSSIKVTFAGSYNETVTFYNVTGARAGQTSETKIEHANWTFSWIGPLSDLSDPSGRSLPWTSEQLTGSTSDTYTDPAASSQDCQNSSLAAAPGQTFSAIKSGSASMLEMSNAQYAASSCALHLGCPGPAVSFGPTACAPTVTWSPGDGVKSFPFSDMQTGGSVATGETTNGSVHTSVAVTPVASTAAAASG